MTLGRRDGTVNRPSVPLTALRPSARRRWASAPSRSGKARSCHRELKTTPYLIPGGPEMSIRAGTSAERGTYRIKTDGLLVPQEAAVYAVDWLRGLDLNQRPLGYEPNELPGCSTPR